MIELRKALHPHLLGLHPQVYFQRAPDTAQYPYLVYDFGNVLDDGEGHQRVVLDIDGWDRPTAGNTAELEIMMAALNRGMNNTTLTTDTLVVSFYLDIKLALTDEDPRIHRRRYTYQGRVFERGD